MFLDAAILLCEHSRESFSGYDRLRKLAREKLDKIKLGYLEIKYVQENFDFFISNEELNGLEKMFNDFDNGKHGDFRDVTSRLTELMNLLNHLSKAN